MTAIQTTARLEDARHLTLAQPLPGAADDLLEVIVMVPDPQSRETVPAFKFQEALGSYYREHPDETRRNSDQWLSEIREGEEG